MENIDKLYVLLKAKKDNPEALKDLNLLEYENIDIKTLEEYVNEKQRLESEKVYENLDDLISGNSIEVDIPEESKTNDADELLSSILEERNEEQSEKEKAIVEKKGKNNIVVIPVKDKDGKKTELVLKIEIDNNNARTVKNIGKIQEDKYIISDETKGEIMKKLEKTAVINTIDTKILEKEFISETPEQLNEMNNEDKLDLEDDKEVAKRAITAQQKEENADVKEEEKPELSEEKRGVAEKVCESTGRSLGTVKKVLIIENPKSATDTLYNDGLNERGEPITVVEFIGTAGKNQYCLMQGNRLLDSRYHDEDIFKLVGHIKQTEGVIREVSDEKTTVTVKSVTGEEQEATIKGMPSDIDQSQKQEMIYEIEVIMDKIAQTKEMDIEQFSRPEDKYKAIDGLQTELLGVFKKYGVEAPNIVREEAETEVTPEELDEEEVEEVEEVEEGRGERTRWGEAGKPDGSNSSIF